MRKISPGQRALDLQMTDVPMDLMREAYERCRLRLSFERSLDVPPLRIALRNVALCLARKQDGR